MVWSLSEVCLVPIEDFYSQWNCSVLFEVWDFKGNRKRPPDLVEKDVTVVAIMGLRGPDIVPNTYVINEALNVLGRIVFVPEELNNVIVLIESKETSICLSKKSN